MILPFAGRTQNGLYVQAALNACNLTATGSTIVEKAGIFASVGKTEEIEGLRGGLFQYGIAFSQKGARKVPDPKNGDFTEFNIRLHYIEVPVNVLFKMRSIKGLLGLSGGYLITQKETGLNGTPFILPTHYKKFDFMGSAGFSVALGNKVLLGLKGSVSILPILPISRVTSSTVLAFSRASRNEVISVGITYIFEKKPPVEQEED